MRDLCKLKTGTSRTAPRRATRQSGAPGGAPDPDLNGNPVLRAAGRLVAVALRALPRRRRFGAAVSLARAIEPVIRRTGAYKTRRSHGSDTLREISLELILMVLTRYGTGFDPLLAV